MVSVIVAAGEHTENHPTRRHQGRTNKTDRPFYIPSMSGKPNNVDETIEKVCILIVPNCKPFPEDQEEEGWVLFISCKEGGALSCYLHTS